MAAKREVTEGQNKKRKLTIMNKPNIIRIIFAFASLLAVTIGFGQSTRPAVAIPQDPPQLRYNVIDLGPEDAPAFGAANAITDSGHIVGQQNLDAAYWPNSQSPAVDLGNLPGFARSVALDINPRGEMVGGVIDPEVQPVYWASSSQSAPVELAGVPEGFFGEAVHINAVGQIVGSFLTPDSSVQQPVFWPNGNSAPIYLPGFGETLPHSLAFSINAAGNIFGDGCDADFVECHAAFWANSASTPVALASPGGEFINTDAGLVSGFSPGLNNAGNMVGVAWNADASEYRAVFWASSTSPAVILSTTGDFINGMAEGISDKGQIVGEAFNTDFSDLHAFMWPISASPGVDLNTMIPSDSGWELAVARGINNRGEIAGTGFLNGEKHGYVLIPVRSPVAPRQRPAPAPRP
jgi:probable HAF family extracellular repeat protein